MCSVVLEKVVLSRLCFVLWWTGSGRDQQGDDMADQMTEPFSSHNDDAQSCVVNS